MGRNNNRMDSTGQDQIPRKAEKRRMDESKEEIGKTGIKQHKIKWRRSFAGRPPPEGMNG